MEALLAPLPPLGSGCLRFESGRFGLPGCSHLSPDGGSVTRAAVHRLTRNAGTVPGYSTSKITNNHSTIINPSLAIPACQRLSKSGQKRGDCPRLFHEAFEIFGDKSEYVVAAPQSRAAANTALGWKNANLRSEMTRLPRRGPGLAKTVPFDAG